VKKRYMILLLLILGIVFAYVLGLGPVRPDIVVKGEPLTAPVDLPLAGPTALTNTFVTLILGDILLLLVAWRVRAFAATGKLVPEGVYNIFEMLVEAMMNLAESTAGKHAKKIFPIMATIILLVGVANLLKIVPGFDSIGLLEPAHEVGKGAPARSIFGLPIYTVVGSLDNTAWLGPEYKSAESETGSSEGGATGFIVTPFLRGASTDLNMTLALALIAMTMTQVYGLQALGPGYLSKFFTLPIDVIAKDPMKAIDPAVGLLELISELAKIISFTFRLFGSMFAGMVLTFVLMTLVPVIVPLPFYLLEIFFGLIQALVFGMLTLTFMSQAMTSHHGGDEHHEEAHA
jgi:F-type H+-transporting ATPase subunit a